MVEYSKFENLDTNFSELLSEIYTFSFKKFHLKVSSEKWRPFCLGLNVLIAVEGRVWQINYIPHKTTNGSCNDRIALKIVRHLSSPAAYMPFKLNFVLTGIS